MEILPFFTSASSSPTTRYFTLSSVSSSISVTVAPNVTWSPLSLLNVDDVGAAKLVLEVRHACLGDALLLLGRMVFGVLGKVPVRARIGDGLDDARALYGLEMLDLQASSAA